MVRRFSSVVNARRRLEQYHPQVLPLEGRLLPGDTLLGILAAQANLRRAELPAAVVVPSRPLPAGGFSVSSTPTVSLSGSPAVAVVSHSALPGSASQGQAPVAVDSSVAGNDPLASVFAADPVDGRAILPPVASQLSAADSTNQAPAPPAPAVGLSLSAAPVQLPSATTILPVPGIGVTPLDPPVAPTLIHPLIPGGSWKTYQHDTAHTGQSPVSLNANDLSFAWQAPQGYSVPLLLGNYAVAMRNQQGIGNDVTSISAFALADGSIQWTYTGQFVFPSQPTFSNGLIVFAASPEDGSGFQLFVLDALTGNLDYTVQLEAGFDMAPMPTVTRNPDTGNLEAFVATGNTVFGVELDATSGTVLWSQHGSFGGFSMPTVVGSSVIVAGPGHFYAFDQTTGDVNQFHNGNISGGGGTTVAYDANLGQFYVLEDYDSSVFGALTAYAYTDNSNIRQLWQVTGPGTPAGNSVAIGLNDDLYMLNSSTVWEIDPQNGHTLRSLLNQNLANNITPIVTDRYLFAFSENHTIIYDLSTFTLSNTLVGARGSLNSAYDSPGAIGPGYFLLDYGNIYGSPGFKVFTAPM